MTSVPELLHKTSRTFALTIPMLPEPTRQEVSLAYLLFRVADTFEDGVRWLPAERLAALAEFRAVLDTDDRPRARALAARCVQHPPTDRAEYVELLAELPFVLERCAELPPLSWALLKSHVLRTASGMEVFVSRTDAGGSLRLESLDDLRGYCYVVAGIVGEMLTELFLLASPGLQPVAATLRARSREFGEGLQLVNILKDAGADAAENRSYLPPTVSSQQVMALARADLRRASEYTQALHQGQAPRGLVTFNLLLVRLANATLDVLRDKGPGAKLSRPEVFAIAADVAHEVDQGCPSFSATSTAGDPVVAA